eukprot:147577_1
MSSSNAVYQKISDFLGSNPISDGDPKPIQSQNTITNPYTKRKKRRYVDMIGDSLCPSLSKTITGQCYDKLRKLENDLDVSIAKRHSFISSQLQNQNTYDNTVTRVLRFELFNTFHINEADDTKNKWMLKLQTKLFNPKDMSQPINAMEYAYHHPFESIISRIKIKLDRDSTSGGSNEIEWNNPNQAMDDGSNTDNSDIDGIQIERHGNKNCTMHLYVYLTNWFVPFNTDTNHDVLCKVSKALGSLLGLGYLSHANTAKDTDTRYHAKSEILQCLHQYLAMYKLIRNDHSMAIDCDDALQKIVGAKTIYCANLWKTLMKKKHVLAPDPIDIEHEICVTGDISENAKIYDVLVRVPSLVAMKAAELMETTHDLHKEESHNGALVIDSLNVQISDVLEALGDEMKERKVLDQYSKDPVSTVDVLVSNQTENLQIISEFAQNASRKSSQYFANSKVYSDIKRYLKKRHLEKESKDKNHN